MVSKFKTIRIARRDLPLAGGTMTGAVDMGNNSIKNFPFLKPQVGNNVTGQLVISRTTGALVANTLYALPFWVVQNCQITASRVIVDTTGGAGNGRLGIYKSLNLDRLDTPSGGALVSDFGTVSAATTGVKPIASLTVNLTPGWHYLAMVVDNATPTWYTVLSCLAGVLTDFGGAAVYGWSVAFTYAALPDPFTTGAATTSTMPIIGVVIGSYS